MLFRQLFDPDSATYTYVLADETTREAVIIDPVLEQLERDVGLLDDLGLDLVYALDTHVHADHVTASGALRERLGARTVVSERAGTTCADELVKDGDTLRFGRYGLEVRETPGHTNGCLTFVTLDRAMAFTGDALLIRGCGRTDFQQGDAATLYDSIHDKVFTLPDDTLVYPGHDYRGRTVTTVGEERRLNPRLGGSRTKADLIEIMKNLGLAYPKQIDRALPRNQQCGREVAPPAPPAASGWAPIEITAAGVPEVSPEWVAAHLGAVTVVDVREPEELRGELGAIGVAEAIPLRALPGPLEAAARDRPLVLVCRSGGRSGKGALQLAALGFKHVASMRGGMTAWRARDLESFARRRGSHQL
ncbi:MAG: MBL fold metallo-hydrolase [Myxococcales bacterium]|nr:MBL fold metallo-hydrolase [Myxococcales bacterium]